MFETEPGEQVETGLTGDELFRITAIENRFGPLYVHDETSMGLSRPGFELLKLAALLVAVRCQFKRSVTGDD